MEERRNDYQFLKKVFTQPLTLEEYQQLKKSAFQDETRMFDDVLADFFTELANCDIQVMFSKEKACFNILFFGPEHVLAPPWESVYTSKEGSLYGEPVHWMRKKLRQFDLNYENKFEEPADHIAIQLAYMEFLINFSLQMIEEHNEASLMKLISLQSELLQQLSIWISQFSRRVQSKADSALYTGAANMLSSLVIADLQDINQLMEELS